MFQTKDQIVAGFYYKFKLFRNRTLNQNQLGTLGVAVLLVAASKSRVCSFKLACFLFFDSVVVCTWCAMLLCFLSGHAFSMRVFSFWVGVRIPCYMNTCSFLLLCCFAFSSRCFKSSPGFIFPYRVWLWFLGFYLFFWCRGLNLESCTC